MDIIIFLFIPWRFTCGMFDRVPRHRRLIWLSYVGTKDQDTGIYLGTYRGKLVPIMMDLVR